MISLSEKLSLLLYRLSDHLSEHYEETAEVYLPVMIALLDLVARWALKISLEDAGADLALLAVGLGIASLLALIEPGALKAREADKPRYTLAGALVLLIGYQVAWIFCLALVSTRSLLAAPWNAGFSVVPGFLALLISAKVLGAVLGRAAGALRGKGNDS